MKETYKNIQKHDLNKVLLFQNIYDVKNRVVKHGNPFVKKIYFSYISIEMEKIMVH